jgi:hypothetical protein
MMYIIYISKRDSFKRVDQMRFSKLNRTEKEKVEAIKSAILAGETMTAVVAHEDDETAITGSHRIQAYHELGMDDEMPVVYISDEDFQKAINAYSEKYNFGEVVYFSEISEMNQFCEVLFDIVEDEEVKTELEDQRSW